MDGGGGAAGSLEIGKAMLGQAARFLYQACIALSVARTQDQKQHCSFSGTHRRMTAQRGPSPRHRQMGAAATLRRRCAEEAPIFNL
jgi:hypothetical protein